MQIRHIQPTLRFDLVSIDDAELLAAVAKRAYADHYLHLWHDGGVWYMERSFSPDVLRRELADANAQFYLVHDEEEPIGFIKINKNQQSPCQPNADALELERIYFRKAATGRGIGEQAMQFVVAHARALNKELVWLKAMDTSHKVLAFYQRMGFVPCGTDRLSFAVMLEEVRGMVILELPLNN
ncbi:GNAT family N-acetyltransferase [Spirosoma aerophilum]